MLRGNFRRRAFHSNLLLCPMQSPDGEPGLPRAAASVNIASSPCFGFWFLLIRIYTEGLNVQTVNQATEIISYVTGTHRGRARQIARALIDAGILPKSSGRDIKKITAKEMLPLFAAIAMAEKVADAAAVARGHVR